MPRGGGFRGGGFRGGGFRGGGFRGGGFRGGGFRGGPRGGGYRGGGRPFGRTGSTRIVSRSPRGPYSHRYYRPHRRYYRPYWWYHRPWYWRWWYSPWWAGHWYRPWYYSPVYIGGGIIFMIVLALIIFPVAGVAFWFPGTNANESGYVNYSSTETLYFNEFWYEYEYIKEGKEITFEVSSTPIEINFAIDNRPFESLPTRTIYIYEVGPIIVQDNDYEYLWMFLRPGSLIEYNFNSSDPVDFLIADAYDYKYINEPNSNNESGSLFITEANDYYIVWENNGIYDVDVDFSVNFTATDVVNFGEAAYHWNNTNSIPEDTFMIPPGESGNWYFFIYFEPMNAPPPASSTTINFEVTYDTGVTYVERWIGVQWILIIVLVVVIIVIIAAVIARRGQKKLKLKAPTTPVPKKPSPYKITPPETVEEEIKCTRCNTLIKPDAKFCPKCGGKIEGRQVGAPSITTPATAKTCSLCGSKLIGTESFCKWCGTKVEK